MKRVYHIEELNKYEKRPIKSLNLHEKRPRKGLNMHEKKYMFVYLNICIKKRLNYRKRDRRYCVYRTSITCKYTGKKNHEKRPIYMKRDRQKRLIKMADIVCIFAYII